MRPLSTACWCWLRAKELEEAETQRSLAAHSMLLACLPAINEHRHLLYPVYLSQNEQATLKRCDAKKGIGNARRDRAVSEKEREEREKSDRGATLSAAAFFSLM